MNDKKERLGQDLAFPTTELEYTGDGFHNWVTEPGMSKRFYAACAAMQGIAATLSDTQEIEEDLAEQIAKESYTLADALLKYENL